MRFSESVVIYAPFARVDPGVRRHRRQDVIREEGNIRACRAAAAAAVAVGRRCACSDERSRSRCSSLPHYPCSCVAGKRHERKPDPGACSHLSSSTARYRTTKSCQTSSEEKRVQMQVRSRNTCGVCSDVTHRVWCLTKTPGRVDGEQKEGRARRCRQNQRLRSRQRGPCLNEADALRPYLANAVVSDR